MVTVEDYKMTGTKITVCEEKFSIYLWVVSLVAALLSMLFLIFFNSCLVAKKPPVVALQCLQPNPIRPLPLKLS